MLQVRLDPELREALEAAAAADGLSRSRWVRAAIKEKLTRDRKAKLRATMAAKVMPLPEPTMPPAPKKAKARKRAPVHNCIRASNPEAFCRICG